MTFLNLSSSLMTVSSYAEFPWLIYTTIHSHVMYDIPIFQTHYNDIDIAMAQYTLSAQSERTQYFSAIISVTRAVQPVKGWLLLPSPVKASYCSQT